jgi:competence protein ComEC
MSPWLAPAAAGAFWAGLLARPSLVRFAPAWAFLALGLAALASAALAAPRPADPDALQGSGLLTEPPALTAVSSQRSLPTRIAPAAALALVLLGCALVAIGWAQIRDTRLDRTLLAQISPAHVEATGSLRADPAKSRFGWQAIARLSSVSWRGGTTVVDETVWLEGDGPVPRAVRGDRIAVGGSSEVPSDAGFAASLRRRGIVALVHATDFARTGGAGGLVGRAAQQFRSLAGDSMHRLFPDREAGLLMGLALGDASGIDPGLERDFQATGLGHLLVASGENVAMLLVPVLALAMLLRLPAWARLALGLVTVAFFVVLTGAEPSVLRAGVMAALAMFGVVSGRPRNTASLLGASVLVLLLLDPTLVWSVGFQLSVAATAGMAALAVPFAERLHALPRAGALAAGTTFAAQLGVTPLLLFHFHEVPVVTLFANLLAFPLVEPAMLLGLAAAIAGRVVAPLGSLLAILALVPLRMLEGLADRLARAPVPWITSGGGLPVLVGGLGVVVLVAWRARTGRRLPRAAGVLAAVIVPVLVWSSALGSGPPGFLQITFFDVGQGDAALVSSPGGARILVDGGPEPDQVAGKLSALGVRRLDLVVASHPHADHIVGLPSVLTRIPVGLVLDPGCPDDSSIYRDLTGALAQEHVPVQHPRAGAAFTVGDLRVDVLSPPSCFTGTDSDANNDAIVFRLTWGSDVVLFATEPEEPAQQEMLAQHEPLAAEVLKVPHHGAATSVPEFFQAVHAQLAVVSVGPNPYGHPVPATLAEIRATGARVLRTDRLGDITVTFTPAGPQVSSSG